MRVSVFGLGYVGCVTAACLAANGHRVVGVDPDTRKIRRVKAGKGTVLEPGLDALVAAGVRNGRLTATTDFTQAVLKTDVSLICVGTPSGDTGALDLAHVEHVARQIGTALQGKSSRHVVVVRSTAVPGTAQELVIPAIEKASHRMVGADFGVCVNPEFMREGTSVADFHEPPFTVVGEHAPGDGDAVAGMYGFVKAPFIRTSLRVAESVKLICNTFHALKIGFANEVGNLCQALEVDGHEVMDILCRDRVLNISPKYLRPGFAFGGSCLPKDLSAVVNEGRRHDVELPILGGILPSNRRQVVRALDLIVGCGKKKIGVIGLSFKEGTDDLRESPMVQLVEMLIGKGYQLKIYDPIVRLSSIAGANRRYIKKEIPHIASLMTSSLPGLLRDAELVVVGQDSAAWRDQAHRVRPDQVVVDLVRTRARKQIKAVYRGLCW
jgi:GDP-mannose 6-dehydrogenase